MSDNNNNKNPVTEPGAEDFFLPDFCATQPLLMLILAAELLAILLVLAGVNRLLPFPWDKLVLTSFLVQWVALTAAALLCKLRPSLMRLSREKAAGLSFALVVLVVVFYSLLVNPVIAGLMLRYFYLQGQLRAKQRTELTARLQALQSRIRPHFLFNCMNIIASLIHVDPDKAETAVEDLSELFRASLKAEGEVPLDEELMLCQRYVNIEKLRLGDRLQVEWKFGNLPDGLRIPALTLQPLMENAIYHGVEPRFEPSEVRVAIDYDGKEVRVVITNPVAPPLPHARGNRMAVDNIRQRLNAHYGESAKLTTHADELIHTTYLSYPLQIGQLWVDAPTGKQRSLT